MQRVKDVLPCLGTLWDYRRTDYHAAAGGVYGSRGRSEALRAAGSAHLQKPDVMWVTALVGSHG